MKQGMTIQQAAAQVLETEAKRFLGEIICAHNVRQLLYANEALERAISDILYAEIDSLKSLSSC